MNQSIAKLMLETIREIGEGTLDAFFPAQYPEARMWRKLLGLDKSYEFSRRSFSAILSRLRREGLVERSCISGRWIWRLTEKGGKKLSDSRAPIKDGIVRLVIFDIPEETKSKRQAIRRKLQDCGYSQLQKSVWQGELPLPQDFFELLDLMRVEGKVHIFSVREKGTLSEKY